MIGSITKKLVESIAFTDCEEYGDLIENTVFNLVSLVVDDMAKTIPYLNISNCLIQPVNETFTSTYMPGSNFVYYLGIDSPQLEINSLTYSNKWNKFKERFVEAWIQSSRRLRKKREKQRRAGLVEERKIEESYEKYTIENLLDDLQFAFAKHLTETTIVYKRTNSIKIVGKDDFGVNTSIIIYPTISDGTTHKLFVSRKKGFISYNFENRLECFNKKLKKIGPNYVFMLKILSHFMRELTKQPSNQIFMESLIYNLPERFLEGDDIYDCFIKIINYLRFTDISQFESVLTPGKTIFNDTSTSNMSFQYSKFLRSFDKINLEIIKHNVES